MMDRRGPMTLARLLVIGLASGALLAPVAGHGLAESQAVPSAMGLLASAPSDAAPAAAGPGVGATAPAPQALASQGVAGVAPGPAAGPQAPPASPSAEPQVHGPLRIGPAAPWVPLAFEGMRDDAPTPITFVCAQGQPGAQDILGDPTQDRVVLGCPIRIYDGSPTEGSFHFGNAALAVSTLDPRQAAFVSLHGDPAPNGMTNRSRTGLTHTTFTTDDQGITWTDQPTQYGGGGANGFAYQGEAASITMDAQGNMYIAFLWSLPNGDAETGHGSRFGLYKAGPPSEQDTATRHYSGIRSYPGRTDHNIITRLGLAHVEPYEPPEVPLANTTEVPPSASDEDVGELASPDDGNRTGAHVVATWHERASVPAESPTGHAAWIDVLVTDTSGLNRWTRINETEAIGPCRDASNPVAWNGLVYVACAVDAGYDHRRSARIGDIDIWAIDPVAMTSTYVATTGLLGGHPMLAATPDGYFAVATSRLDGENGATIQTAYGWYGQGWSRGGDLGPELHRLAGSFPTHDAAVTGITITPREKTIALVYMEWQKTDGPVRPQPPPTAPDPANPQLPTPRMTDYKKVLLAYNECGILAASAMQLGVGVDPQTMQAYQERPSLFDDQSDGLVAGQDAGGRDVVHFAINDYGAMQFGAFVAPEIGSYCPITPPLAPTPPPALPQALTLSSPATTAIGSVVGLASVAMVTYILAVRRRSAAAVTAEDK